MDKDITRELAREAWKGDNESFLVLQDAVEEEDPKLAEKLRSDDFLKVIAATALLAGWTVVESHNTVRVRYDHHDVDSISFGRTRATMRSSVTGKSVEFDYNGTPRYFDVGEFHVEYRWGGAVEAWTDLADNAFGYRDLNFHIDADLEDPEQLEVGDYTDVGGRVSLADASAYVGVARDIQNAFKDVEAELGVFLNALRRGLGLRHLGG